MPVSQKPTELSPSRALLSAALSALLWAAPACGGGGGSGPDTTTPAAIGNSGGGGADAGPPFECDGGVSPNPAVTAKNTIGPLTLEAFTAQCLAQSGVVEIQPHCGGSNNCRGLSYDSELGTMLAHTCRGTNTCAGYSCIICG